MDHRSIRGCVGVYIYISSKTHTHTYHATLVHYSFWWVDSFSLPFCCCGLYRRSFSFLFPIAVVVVADPIEVPSFSLPSSFVERERVLESPPGFIIHGAVVAGPGGGGISLSLFFFPCCFVVGYSFFWWWLGSLPKRKKPQTNPKPNQPFLWSQFHFYFFCCLHETYLWAFVVVFVSQKKKGIFSFFFGGVCVCVCVCVCCVILQCFNGSNN